MWNPWSWGRNYGGMGNNQGGGGFRDSPVMRRPSYFPPSDGMGYAQGGNYQSPPVTSMPSRDAPGSMGGWNPISQAQNPGWGSLPINPGGPGMGMGIMPGGSGNGFNPGIQGPSNRTTGDEAWFDPKNIFDPSSGQGQWGSPGQFGSVRDAMGSMMNQAGNYGGGTLGRLYPPQAGNYPQGRMGRY
jgi:hypothetical protein